MFSALLPGITRCSIRCRAPRLKCAKGNPDVITLGLPCAAHFCRTSQFKGRLQAMLQGPLRSRGTPRLLLWVHGACRYAVEGKRPVQSGIEIEISKELPTLGLPCAQLPTRSHLGIIVLAYF